MALVYCYLPANRSQKTIYATTEIAISRQYLYNWELCLKAGQIYPMGHQEINQIDLKAIQLPKSASDRPLLRFPVHHNKCDSSGAILVRIFNVCSKRHVRTKTHENQPHNISRKIGGIAVNRKPNRSSCYQNRIILGTDCNMVTNNTNPISARLIHRRNNKRIATHSHPPIHP